MIQVIREALDVFAALLLEALDFDYLGDQHVIGLTDGLSRHVRRPRKPPIRDRVQRPADDVAILRHQALKVLGQVRRTQLKPNEKSRRRTDQRSVVDNRNTTNGVIRPDRLKVGGPRFDARRASASSALRFIASDAPISPRTRDR